MVHPTIKKILHKIHVISLGGAPGDIQCNKAPIPRKIWKLFTKREASDVYIAKNPLIGTLFRLNYPVNC